MPIAYIKIFHTQPPKLIKQIEQNQTLLMFTNIWFALLSDPWRVTLPKVPEVSTIVARLLDLADGT